MARHEIRVNRFGAKFPLNDRHLLPAPGENDWPELDAKMVPKIATSLMALLFLTPLANAAEEKIDSALSAAPTSLSRDARVMDWDGNTKGPYY